MQGTSGARMALLGTGLISFVLMGLTQAIFGPALPVFKRQFDLDTAAAGWLISAFWVGCFLGVVVMFLAAGKVGARMGLAATGLGAALLGLGPVWPVVLLGGVFFGMGYGTLAADFNPRVLQAFGPRGPSMMTLLNAVFSVGAIAAPLAFIWMGSDPKPAFLAIAGLAAVIWLGSGSVARAKLGVATATGGFRMHWPTLLFGVLAIGMEAALVGLGPTALMRSGQEEVEAAKLLSLFYLAYLLTRSAMVFVVDRVPAFTIFTGAMVFATLCAAGAVFVSPAVFFPLLGVSGSLFFHGFFVTGTQKMGGDARVAPVLIGSGLFGATVLPLLCAQVVGGMGDRGFFWLVLGWAGVLALGALVSLRAMNRPAEDQAGFSATRPLSVR